MAAPRLEQVLVDLGLAPTVERARGEIRAGNVLVDERPVDKPATPVRPGQVVRLRQAPARYVSRGGLKLEAALMAFGVEVADRVCVDLGASTGGFTDCLLQHGARRVFAVDVGYNQLAWSLRTDPRVVVMERTDARTLEGLPEPCSLLVADVSFISLGPILPVVRRLLHKGAAVLLVKPQFEVGRARVEKGGLVSDPEARQDALDGVLAQARAAGFLPRGHMESPVPGARAGNREWLVHLDVLS